MALEYTWTLRSLKKRNNSIMGLDEIIVQTYWELTGTDENGFSGTFSGATPFDPNGVDLENFTSYDELTEEQVLGWIKDVVENNPGYKEHIDNQILEQIELKKNPIEEATPNKFPWSSSPGTTAPQP